MTPPFLGAFFDKKSGNFCEVLQTEKKVLSPSEMVSINLSRGVRFVDRLQKTADGWKRELLEHRAVRACGIERGKVHARSFSFIVAFPMRAAYDQVL